MQNGWMIYRIAYTAKFYEIWREQTESNLIPMKKIIEILDKSFISF